MLSIVGAISDGIELSILTLGFALIINYLKIIDFSYSSRIVLSSYLMLYFYSFFNFYVSVLFTLIISIFISIFIGRFLIIPFKNSGAAKILIYTLGLSLVLQSSISMLSGTQKTILGIREEKTNILNRYPRELALLLFLVIFFIYFHNLLKNTILGKSLKAFASNPTLAIAWRINPNKLVSYIYGMSGMLSSIVGISLVISDGIEPRSGINLIIVSFLLILLGGENNILGVVIACILYSFINYNLAILFNSDLADSITYCILFGLLFLRPRGIAEIKKRIFT